MPRRTSVCIVCLAFGQILLGVTIAYLWLGASFVDNQHGRGLDGRARALVLAGGLELDTISARLVDQGYAEKPFMSEDDLGIWMSQGTAYVSVQIMRVAACMIAGSLVLACVPLILIVFRRHGGSVP